MTHVKQSELLSNQKASANMVTSKSNKFFFRKKKKFNKKNHNLKNLNIQKNKFNNKGVSLWSIFFCY